MASHEIDSITHMLIPTSPAGKKYVYGAQTKTILEIIEFNNKYGGISFSELLRALQNYYVQGFKKSTLKATLHRYKKSKHIALIDKKYIKVKPIKLRVFK